MSAIPAGCGSCVQTSRCMFLRNGDLCQAAELCSRDYDIARLVDALKRIDSAEGYGLMAGSKIAREALAAYE